MEEQWIKGRVLHIRELATKADPLIKRRLLDLANNYERRLRQAPRPTAKLTDDPPSDQAKG